MQSSEVNHTLVLLYIHFYTFGTSIFCLMQLIKNGFQFLCIGIFTIAGIVDSSIYYGQKTIKKKMEIGKYRWWGQVTLSFLHRCSNVRVESAHDLYLVGQCIRVSYNTMIKPSCRFSWLMNLYFLDLEDIESSSHFHVFWRIWSLQVKI